MIRAALIAAALAAAALVGAPSSASAASPRDTRVPILLYHHIAEAPADASSPALWVAPAVFAEQMDALARAGHHAVTLEQAWAAWTRGRALPSKPVIVSFDDGYADQMTEGLPVLREHGWSGVLNLQTNRIGVAGGVSRADVRRLIRLGWEIDPHSVTHPDLTQVSARRLREEVAGSRRVLKRLFGVAARFFCYPFGHYDRRVERAVEAAGFLGATTTKAGAASRRSGRFSLPRVIVTERLSGDDLARRLRSLQSANES